MNRKYIIELTGINEDYQDDVEGNIEELFNNVIEFSEEIKITDITDDEEQ